MLLRGLRGGGWVSRAGLVVGGVWVFVAGLLLV